MTEQTEIQLLKFFDSEFARRKGYADPKIVFRAKDAVAGTLSIRQITGGMKKSETAAMHGLRIAMGKLLVDVAQGSGQFGAYRVRMLTATDTGRGTRFMAQRVGEGICVTSRETDH